MEIIVFKKALATSSQILFISLLCFSISFSSVSGQAKEGAAAEDIRCAVGFYGPHCQQRCHAKCVSTMCDAVTGNCQGSCEDGWTGSLCDQECSNGTYGNNCSLSCPANCKDRICNNANGSCTKGCESGFSGKMCETTCSKGFYGESCKTPCPKNCAKGQCDPVTGHCLAGCKKAFWGSDCSLSGGIRKLEEPDKRKFYGDLSAEGRSVLLYILMNKYTESLQRAEQLIAKCVQQRNQLAVLLQGKR